ncbi:hypothetical protein INT45_012880, partial [Circinella minor]
MSTSESSSSISNTDLSTFPITSSANLPYIKGYHFMNTISCSRHYENVEIISGYKISNKSSVVGKVSPSSLQLEREFYIMKKLYQYIDGSSYLVRPLEYLSCPNGLAVAIYSDDGQNHYSSNRQSEISEKGFNTQKYESGSLCRTLGTFLRFAIKCLTCLEYIHKHNVIHGEICPSAFQWNGVDGDPVKLWNFGSGSKSLESFFTTENWRKTTNNKDSMEQLQNRLMYMSPEQTGRTTYAPDHRSDIYSLGIMLFTLLTGQNPFDGGPLEILHAILSRKLPLIHEQHFEVPQIVSRIIEKMTNKSPGDRYTSAHGVKHDLQECLKLLTSTQKSSTADVSIPLFTLAQHDIASIFTLPKTVYGRQDVLSEISFFIDRCATQYNPSRFSHRAKLSTDEIHSQTIATTAQEGVTNEISGHLSDTNSTRGTGEGYASSSVSSQRGHCSSGNLIASNTLTSTGSKKESFNNSKTSSCVTIVGVYGPGGIGKSTLFTEVQPTARQYGYVAVSKFDSRNKVPYSALAKVLSYILQQILSESEDDIRLFYDHLKVSLGVQYSNIGLMTDFVPELNSLLKLEEEIELKSVGNEIGTDSSTGHKMDDMETRTRFHNLYIEIFRAITYWRMTTLFLDDLHQADEPSLELMESLITSRIQLLIFMSYRDQEITKQFEKNILGSSVADIYLIHVEALGMDSLIDFICDSLHRSHNDIINRNIVSPLAEIIFNQTQGNVFYVRQLLQTLERKQLIYYDWEINEWCFDLQEIKNSSILDNSNSFDSQQLDFMVDRLRELPPAGRVILKWASFVGDTFSWNTVRSLVLEDIDNCYEEVQGNDHNDDDGDNDQYSTSTTADNSAESISEWTIQQNSNDKRKPFYRTKSSTSTIASTTSNDPISGLQAVLQEGYIMSIGIDEFKWSHDRISQAASELVNPATRAKMHLKIAQHMMKEKYTDSFLLADHLLKCVDLLLNMDNKQQYRDILIHAGNKGRASGAHQMAFAYFMCAVQLGDLEAQWIDDDKYHTTLSLYNNVAALSWSVAQYDTTEELLETIFKHSRTPSDRIYAYRVQARYFFGIQQHAKGIEALYRCMDEFSDERSRIDTSKEELIKLYNEIETLVETQGVDYLLKLPMCDDPSFIGALGVMEELLTMAYWSERKLEMYYWAVRILKLSFTRGPVGSTSSACVFAGVGYTVLCQNYTFAEKIGSIGISLTDQQGTAQEKGLAYWWRASFSAGDRIFAAFNSVDLGQLMFYSGHHTADVLHDAEQRYDEIHTWSPNIDPNSLIMCIIRTTKALQGQTYIDTPYVFDGDDGFTDSHFLTESCLHIYIQCIRHTRMMLFYFSLALIEKCRHDPTQKEKYFAQVRVNQEYIHEYMVHSPINFSMYWTLIEAELIGFSETPSAILQASRLYEDALNQAREGNWYFELCIIHEYTGDFYYRTGFQNIAYCLIKKTIDMYLNHGSYGKARHVSTKFSKLLIDFDDSKAEPRDIGIQTDILSFSHGRQTPPNDWNNGYEKFVQQQNPNNSSSIYANNVAYVEESIPPVTTEQTLQCLDIIDMASILKSSHVISSEVRFDRLLISMMDIIFENSGADRGAIIVREEKYGVCAYGCQNEQVATYDPPKPLDDADELVPCKIINHTIHTGESIFIYNVKKDTRFAVGPWFKRTSEKSVICMPITHKSRTMGCLVIEGAVGAFTQRHVTVLSLLCQQMGISTSNASLFKSVQRATMANIRMIEMQKQALEEARRSREAAVRATRLREIFLANMSHEIRTPFAGFYGMISLLSETELDPEQHDLVHTAKESCEMLLRLIDDLLNFSKLQAGKVALDLSEVVIEDVITDVVEMLIAIALQKKLNIVYEIMPDVPLIVITDGNRLRQIIINLLGNAIKFTHEGEIKIRCSIDKDGETTCVKENDQNEVSLLFEVIDSGIGISDEQRKALFVPFSQVDGSTTRKYGGTGLGLSICLQLVRLMSGEINVKSELSKGSTFFFNIRVTPVPVEQYKSSSYKQITELLKDVRDTRILVADKHASTTTLVKQLLPGTVVDGVSSVQELLSCNLKNYSVIVIGLFLSLDSKSPARVDRIKQFLERGQCVLVMHYPTNLVGEILGNSNINNNNQRDTNTLQPQDRKTRTDHLISVLDDNNSLI